MKRLRLFNPPPTEPAGKPWRELVTDALCASDVPRLVELFRTPGWRKRLLEGFTIGGGTTDQTFAQLCLHVDGIKELRELMAQVPAITLDDVCSYDATVGKFSVSWEMSLFEEALRIDFPRPDALRLAIEKDPESETLIQPLERFNGSTLHYEAVTMLVAAETVDKAAKLADICQQLLEHKAPIGHKLPGLSMDAAELFFRVRWKAGAAAVIAPVVRKYMEAGLVDLDQPLQRARCMPAELAVMNGSAEAAVFAIDAGCDLSMCRSGEHQSLLELAQERRTDPDGHVLAAVTQALMRRQLRERACADSGDSHPTPARARRGRFGL